MSPPMKKVDFFFLLFPKGLRPCSPIIVAHPARLQPSPSLVRAQRFIFSNCCRMDRLPSFFSLRSLSCGAQSLLRGGTTSNPQRTFRFCFPLAKFSHICLSFYFYPSAPPQAVLQGGQFVDGPVRSSQTRAGYSGQDAFSLLLWPSPLRRNLGVSPDLLDI